MPIVKLDSDFIKHHLQCPHGQRKIEFCSSEIPGLIVTVSDVSPGKGTYLLRYKVLSQTKYIKIGRTYDISLADAKKKALALKSEIAAGGDPRQEKVDMASVPTLTVFMEEHYFPYVRPRKRTAYKDEELFRLRLKKAFGHMQINRITRQQIQAFHTSVRGEGLAPASCDHYLKLLRHALNLAVDWEMLDRNPAARVPLFNIDNKIEHYLDEKQLGQLMYVLINDSNRPVCSIVLYLLSTGARMNEALQAKWEHIDRRQRLWRIPSEISKSKKVRSVPLNETALAILDDLETEGKYEHLFVNVRTGKPYTTIHKVFDRLRREAGLPHLRIHDLRHAFASCLISNNRSLFEVQQILGHSSPIVTQRYAHLSTKALQEATSAASDVITDAMPEST
jgi:integrase